LRLLPAASRPGPGRLAGALAAALLALPALGQERPLSARFDTTVAWENNLFRLADTAPDPHLARGLPGRTDRITTSNLSARFAKTYALQSVSFDATATDIRYDKFSFLDRQTYAYRGAWNWHLTPRISGSVGFDRNESPLPFDQTRDVEANSLISTNRHFTLAASPFGGWQVIGGLRQSDRAYSRPYDAQPNTTQNGVEAGLRYTAASQSSITLLRRSQSGTGSTTQAVGSATALGTGKFTLDETELTASWPVSGKSALDARLATMERRHADAPERDFSGLSGSLSHRWTPTGRLSLVVSASRNLTPFIQDTRSSYMVQNTLSVVPSWQLSDKVRVTVTATRQSIDFLGAIGPQTTPARHDVLRNFSLGADWSPYRLVSFSASLRRDQRASTDGQFSYEATVANVGATLNF
jgi:exopolysaccharide biosynthesis operon protein EpsL